jgi:hypothetical protein
VDLYIIVVILYLYLSFREFVEQDLLDFTQQNPGIVVYIKPRRHRTPMLRAEYCKKFYVTFIKQKFFPLVMLSKYCQRIGNLFVLQSSTQLAVMIIYYIVNLFVVVFY